jgi:hypothetical protein
VFFAATTGEAVDRVFFRSGTHFLDESMLINEVMCFKPRKKWFVLVLK